MHIANPTRNVIRTLAALGLLLCATAQAQPVRKCQIDGNTAYQSSPFPVEARVASAVPPAATIDNSATPKKKTLADLLRERVARADGRGLKFACSVDQSFAKL